MKLREAYLESKLHKSNIAITNRTIKILCDSSYETHDDIFVTVGFAIENKNIDKLFTDNIIAWLDKWNTHGEFLISESDVKEVFEKSNVEFAGFNVRYADNETTKEFKEEIELHVK